MSFTSFLYFADSFLYQLYQLLGRAADGLVVVFILPGSYRGQLHEFRTPHDLAR